MNDILTTDLMHADPVATFAEISTARANEVFTYDPNIGTFKWKIKIAKKVVVGDTAGFITKDGYIQIGIDGFKVLAHRLVFIFMNTDVPRIIDHRNGVRADNRFSNLRKATSSLNATNRIGASGVFEKSDGKFTVNASLDGVTTHFGVFLNRKIAEIEFQHIRHAIHDKQIDLTGCSFDNSVYLRALHKINRTRNSRLINLRTSNTSGVEGVCWDSSSEKWSARIGVSGRQVKLGKFHCKEDAMAARKNAELAKLEGVLK